MKSLLPALAKLLPKSRPARGAWIEIQCRVRYKVDFIVAPRTGRVD